MQSENKKILITGAGGDIGSVVAEDLSKDGYDLSCLSRKEGLAPPYLRGDLNDYASLLSAVDKIDAVVHIAGATGGGARMLERVNVEGTKNLLRACREKGVTRILYISSLDVVFDTPYGRSKKKAEEAVVNSGLRYCILRPSVVYGRGFRKDLMLLAQIIKKSCFIPVPGSGANLYQPLYVKDLSAVIKKVLAGSRFDNSVYFIGGGDKVSMNDLIDIIGKVCNKKVYKLHIPIGLMRIGSFVLSIFGMKMDVENYTVDKTCDIEPLRKDFDFTPTGLAEGLREAIL